MVIAELKLDRYASTVRFVESDSILASDTARTLVVFDENTVRLPLRPLPVRAVVIPGGERAKQLAIWQAVLASCTGAGLTRQSRVIGVGGGAVTDVVALAASTYLRGVRLVLVPTTLLAMVDAAIGGKTGVNFSGRKNIVGTFYPAEDVRICPELVSTLSDKEYRSGLAEVIKAGLLGDSELVRILESQVPAVTGRDPGVVREMIRRAIRVKADVVNGDFKETGRRAILNLGHTFAHALEAVVGLGEWTHGAAVAWGIAQAVAAGIAIGITEPDYGDRVVELLKRYDYVVDGVAASPDALIEAMGADKKRTETAIRFVLQRRLGETSLEAIPLGLVRNILESQLQGGTT